MNILKLSNKNNKVKSCFRVFCCFCSVSKNIRDEKYITGQYYKNAQKWILTFGTIACAQTGTIGFIALAK